MCKNQLMEDFVAWLVTERNRNGSLYLENVARCYARYLQTAPLKLDLPLMADKRNVYSCRTIEEFASLCNVFRTSPNFKAVDYASSHNSFSAGLHCYERYLHYLAIGDKSSGKSNGEETSMEKNAIEFLYDNNTNFNNESKCAGFAYTNACTATYPVADKETITALDIVLAEKFSNGFRFTSEIEIGRLRKFASDLLSKEIILSDHDIIEYVKECGTEFDGKIYIVGATAKSKIVNLAKEYFDRGAKAIFYEEFYVKHELWLFEANVVSRQMLTEIFRAEFQLLMFTSAYFGKTSESIYNVLKSEILRVWGDDILLTYERLAERLEYIPLERIKYALIQTADFIWNGRGEFTHIGKFDIAKEEQDEIRRFAERKINEHGYVSLADFPLNELIERNYELSRAAVHTCVYQICLTGDYDQHGRIIITRKGDVPNILSIIEDHCRSLDHCSLEDLLDFERGISRWIPMQAGYNVMVRTDANTFVAEHFVRFKTTVIDNAIEQFMNGADYLPLKSFTTFVMFPYCGQDWNLFLLESYAFRFSELFQYKAGAINSQNVGVIIRKNSPLVKASHTKYDKDYDKILVDAIAKSNISLEEDCILKFLFDEGYIAKRFKSNIKELLMQAKFLRERR